METRKTFDSFPAWMVLLTNLFSILLYTSGVLILYKMGVIVTVAYIMFIAALEVRLIGKHCIDCYYYGKLCGFGKGSVSALFFKKGDPVRFCSREMKWIDLLTDLLVSLIPFIAGVILLFIQFDPVVLASLVVLFLLTTAGNSFIRGSIACKFCKQRELGCPAEKLFNKEKKQS